MNQDTKKEEWISVYENEKNNFISSETIKKQSLNSFRTLNFPERKTENWKYTKATPFVEGNYQLSTFNDIDIKQIEQFFINDLQAIQLVFVNGFFSEKLSSYKNETDGITVLPINKAVEEKKEVFEKYYNSTKISDYDVFNAFNTAFAQNGAFVEIEKNEETEKTVYLLFINTLTSQPTFNQLRNLIVAQPNSKLNVVTSFHSINEGVNFTNATTEILLQENAEVQLYCLQDEKETANILNTTKVIQEKNSTFGSHSFTHSGNLVRNQMHVDISGENCYTELNGVFMPINEQVFDINTSVVHQKPNCKSSQSFRGIANDKATGTFAGKVFVAKGADKTDAYQSNKNVVLSPTAKINSKPQLEIYTEDVSCSHGSSTGQLDAEALFYLKSRGISEDKAKALLLYAFAGDVLNKIKLEPFRVFVDKIIAKNFGY